MRDVLNRSRETVQRIEAVYCWQGEVQRGTLHPSLDALSSQPLLSVKVKLPFFSEDKDAKGARVEVPNKVYWFTRFRKNSCEIMQAQLTKPLDV